MSTDKAGKTSGKGSSGNPVPTMGTALFPPPHDSSIRSRTAPVSKSNRGMGSAEPSVTSSPALAPDPIGASRYKARKYHSSVPLEGMGAKLQKYVP